MPWATMAEFEKDEVNRLKSSERIVVRVQF